MVQERASIFNVPRVGHSRPEHHRPPPPPPRAPSPDFIEIARPATFAVTSVPAAPRPLFSTANTSRLTIGYQLPTFARPSAPAGPKPLFSTANTARPVNAYIPPGSTLLNLTPKDDDDAFNPDKALGIRSYDPSLFLDAGMANDNIKALLEGAFEDEDDKPRTRLRKKNSAPKKNDSGAHELVDSLGKLKVAYTEAEAESKHEAPPEDDEDEDDGSVEGLNIKLLPHQIDGVAWMLDKEIGTRKKNGVLPKGGILADDMGLGKTIQALSLILSNRRPSADDLADNPKLKVPASAGKGTLVVAPLALIKQWEGEIKNKVDTFPKLKVLVHHGQSRTKRSDDLRKYDIVITTYQTLTSEHGESSPKDDGIKIGCFGVHWYRIMLDEAHTIKNRNAKMTKAAYDLKSVYRWCLTGTPMQNNLDELQSLIHFLRIKPYSDLASWREQIGQPMKNGRGGLAMKRLQYFLKAFMKRRTKDVLKKEGGLNFGKCLGSNGEAKTDGFKIVGRDVQTITTDFNPSEREFYDRLEERTKANLEAMMGGARSDYIGALVLLLRLRQTCNHPELTNAKRDKDSVVSSQQLSVPETPRKSKSSSAVNDLDDVADMFGALTVSTQNCDGCGSKLSRLDLDDGIIRCIECEEDIKKLRLSSSNHAGWKKKTKQEMSEPIAPSLKKVHRIIDSDEEDEDEDTGDWVVRKHRNEPIRFGGAGGGEDEDAESLGESLGMEDSDTENEEEDDDSSKDSQEEISSEDDSIVPNRDPRLIASTKIRRLLQLLEAESDDHKFIVFSEFTSMLDIIEPFLRSAGFRFTRYDGSMKNDDREASLERLRNDSTTRILLCSLRCGSLGLNLTAASRVVILEPFWNPFVEEQAIDRVHRLNQTRDVVVYRLTVANTVEERIIALQDKKRELAKAAIEGGKAVGKLSMQDILRLFKRDAEHDSRHEDRSVAALAARTAVLVHRRAEMGMAERSVAPTYHGQ